MEHEVLDICKNLPIEQILVRAYRELSPKQQTELRAISSRTGIHMNDLLKEALAIGLPLLKKEGL